MNIDLSQWQVILVDDEIDAQDVVIPLLTRYGANVSAVESAEEALMLINEVPPTLVIADLALPNMNGWELLQTMLGDPNLVGIPVVAVTAYHSTSVARQAIEAGFAAFFPKPINARSFAEDLVKLVG